MLENFHPMCGVGVGRGVLVSLASGMRTHLRLEDKPLAGQLITFESGFQPNLCFRLYGGMYDG